MGPKMLRLLEAHWAGQLMIAKEQGFYGPPFGTSRGMTQGSKFSPSAFNIIVDKVVRYWLALVLEDDGGTVVLDGLGLTVRERLPLFYADDGFVGSRDSVWLQQALDVLLSLFRREGLEANIRKNESMTFFPGHITTGLSNRACEQ